MPAVSFNPKFRRTWMFSRPIRKISPWKLGQIISLLVQMNEMGGWTGNQNLQNAFIQAMNKAGIKTGGRLRDLNSGGARTYFALLRLLGLVFLQNDRIYLTIAGEALCKGMNFLPVLQTMLFRMQYPCTYSISQNVKIHPEIKIKPIRFIFRFLRDPEILYLRQNELIILIIYGHNDSQFDFCKGLILQHRKGTPIEELIDDPEKDLYVPRSKRVIMAKEMAYYKDIANTLKNYMQSACLINIEVADSLIIKVNEDYSYLIDSALADDKFITLNPADEESFQRAYGCWDRMKDNRKIVDYDGRTSYGEGIIISQFFEYAGNHIVTEVPSDFILSATRMGFDPSFIEKVIGPYLERSLEIFESTYIEYSRSGTKYAVAFEKATCEIFRDRLLFKAEHTGQKKKSKKTGPGAYADGFLTALDNCHCAILDAKAIASYNLGSDDYYNMTENYMKNYAELTEGKDLKLEFCLYVAAGFSSGFEAKIKEMYSKTGIPVSGIRAVTLLEIAGKKINPSDQPFYREVFRKNKILERADFY